MTVKIITYEHMHEIRCSQSVPTQSYNDALCMYVIYSLLCGCMPNGWMMMAKKNEGIQDVSVCAAET